MGHPERITAIISQNGKAASPLSLKLHESLETLYQS
jgi:hypothetical protein